MENAFDEKKFLGWYRRWAKVMGLDPDPDSPMHYYDYRAAYRAGMGPKMTWNPATQRNEYHWPSQFKAWNHPNRYVMVEPGVMLDSKADTLVGNPTKMEPLK